MNLSLTKKILLSVLGLGVVGSLVGMGTFASFTAAVTNNASTFQTGTVLITSADATTTCYSTSGGVNGTPNGAPNTTATICTSVFTLTNQKPGTAISGTLSINNIGTLPATLKLTDASCSGAGVAGNADGVNNNGAGDLCAVVLTRVRGNNNANAQCVYGTNCSTFTSAETLDAFVTAANADITLKPRPDGAVAATNTWVANGGAGDAVTYTFSFQLPDTGAGAENAYQGRKATLSVTWTATQA